MIDYDDHVQRIVFIQATKYERVNQRIWINETMSFSPAGIIRLYSNASDVQSVDRSLDDFNSQILSVESRIAPDRREKEVFGRFFFEFCRCVCKAIGTREETCMAELKNRSGFQNLPRPVQYFKLSAIELYHQIMRVFTIEPASQWIEITDSCTDLSVNPGWFSGHRVYQFPVRVDWGQLKNGVRYYECKLITDNLNDSVLTFIDLNDLPNKDKIRESNKNK